jgi:hypothetical protein
MYGFHSKINTSWQAELKRLENGSPQETSKTVGDLHMTTANFMSKGISISPRTTAEPKLKSIYVSPIGPADRVFKAIHL